MFTILRIPKFLVIFLLLLVCMESVLLWQTGVFAIPFLNVKSMQALSPTAMDILFAVVSGFLFSLLLTGFTYLIGEAREKVLKKEASLSGLALVFSVLALLCPVCNLGIFVFFGLAVNLQFLVPYISLLQWATILCLLAAVLLMDYRIRHICLKCARP